MSESNFELLRPFYDAFNKQDSSGFGALFDEQGVWHQVTPLPDRDTYHGPAAIQGLVQGIIDSFGPIHLEIERYVDAGDHVAVIGTIQGATSVGLPVEFDYVHIWRFENGRAVWVYDCAGESRPA